LTNHRCPPGNRSLAGFVLAAARQDVKPLVVGSIEEGDPMQIEDLEGTWDIWGGPEGVKKQADRPHGLPLSHRLLIALFSLLVIFLSCTPRTNLGPDPGEGEGAIRGYDLCVPLITAVEEYRKANKDYPESLDELVPDYLKAVPTGVNGDPIIYTKQDGTYTLTFSYSGPGNNVCIYAPEHGWHCSGAY
jgi:hypothetical protein